jgi:hypothetical protein
MHCFDNLAANNAGIYCFDNLAANNAARNHCFDDLAANNAAEMHYFGRLAPITLLTFALLGLGCADVSCRC